MSSESIINVLHFHYITEHHSKNSIMGSRHVLLMFVIVSGYPQTRPYSTYISSLQNIVCVKHPLLICYTYLQKIMAIFQILHRPAPQHFLIFPNQSTKLLDLKIVKIQTKSRRGVCPCKNSDTEIC